MGSLHVRDGTDGWSRMLLRALPTLEATPRKGQQRVEAAARVPNQCSEQMVTHLLCGVRQRLTPTYYLVNDAIIFLELSG